MKHICILLGLLALLAAPLTSITAQPNVEGYVNTALLNLRPVPSPTNNTPIAQLPQNTGLTLHGRTADNNWYRAIYDPDGFSEIQGWVRSSYITLTYGTPDELPVIDGTSPNPYFITNGRVNTDALNIRPQPTVNNSPLTTRYRGALLDVTGRSPDATWFQVRLGGGQLGWARSTYIDLVGGVDIGALPVRLEQTPPTLQNVRGEVNTGALNIRTVPRWWGNHPITFVYRGTPLTIIGRNSDASWYNVQLADGTTGWARSRYIIATSGNPLILPVTG